MKVKYLGHSSFFLASQGGVSVITDPYTPGGGLSYKPITMGADIVTVTHEHGDHNNVSSIPGNPQVVRGAISKDVAGVHFEGTAAYHDSSGGRERGTNIIFSFTLDGVAICYLGDLGHTLSEQQLAALGKVDLLLIPVGGFFTIDAAEATQVCDALKPRVVVPMHYKTPKCDFPLAGLDKFLDGKSRVRKPQTPEVEFRAEDLPDPYEVVVLRPTQ
ncbi:MAG: MBL fold metallo-hydrolase [Dehalococcoidia bacterium]